MIVRHAVLLLIVVLSFAAVAPTQGLAQVPEYTLDELYRLGLKTADRIKIAEQEVAVAQAQQGKGFSFLLPGLSTYGEARGYSRSVPSDTGSTLQPDNTQTFNLRLYQSLSLGGRELTAYKMLKENVTKTKFDLTTVREEYLQRIAAFYYEALRAIRSIEIAEANVARLKTQRDAAASRLRVGEVTKTALLRAEAQLSGADSDVVKTKNRLDLARADLARIVGITGNYKLTETTEPGIKSMEHGVQGEIIDGCSPTNLICLQDKALAQRSELKALDQVQKIAENNVKFAKGAYWPIFSVEGVYTRQDQSPPTGNLVRDSAYGGVRLTMLLFEGGYREADIAEAKAKQRQANLAYEDTKKTVNIEVENAYLVLKTQVGILKSLEDQVTFARDNYQAVSKQFEFGLANIIDVIDATTTLVTAERDLLDAQFLYQLSLLRIRRVTGTLLKGVAGDYAAVNEQKR
jgi:outer membrane protein